MNYIFCFLIILSIVFGLINGTLDKVVESIFTSSKNAVNVSISLIGIMAFWLGVMKIAEKSEFVKIIQKIIYPISRFIFNEVDKDSKALSDITMNVGANALGLSNAATPFGLKAISDLKEEEIKKNPSWDKISATNSMCILLAINTAGVPAIPTTVMGVLHSFGEVNPSYVILPSIIIGFFALVFAIFVSKILERFYK